jgi:hypothetical protein
MRAAMNNEDCDWCWQDYYAEDGYGGMFSMENYYTKIPAKYCAMCGKERVQKKLTYEDYGKFARIKIDIDEEE